MLMGIKAADGARACTSTCVVLRYLDLVSQLGKDKKDRRWRLGLTTIPRLPDYETLLSTQCRCMYGCVDGMG